MYISRPEPTDEEIEKKNKSHQIIFSDMKKIWAEQTHHLISSIKITNVFSCRQQK